MVAALQLAAPYAIPAGCYETYRLIQQALSRSGYEFEEHINRLARRLPTRESR